MKKPAMTYGQGNNVKVGKYGSGSEKKGREVNGSFETPAKVAGSHRKTLTAPRIKGHQFSRKGQ